MMKTWNIIKKGKEVPIKLNDGDAVIYKGCERPHWRDPLKSRYSKIQRGIRKLLKRKMIHIIIKSFSIMFWQMVIDVISGQTGN